MNRTLALGFAAGVVFVASIVIGLVVSDALTDQGDGEPRLPGALGEPIEIVSAVPVGTDEADPTVDASEPIESGQTALIPVGAETPSRGGGTGGAPGFDAGGDPGTDEATTDITAVDGPVLDEITIPGLPEGIFRPDLYFELLDFGPFRFVDLCADNPGLPACPGGIGGTILMPLGGGFDVLGDFRLGDRLGVAASDATCQPTSSDGVSYHADRAFVHPVLLWASHPADFDIRWYPIDLPEVRRDDRPTVSNADPDHPEFVRFAENATEGRLATSPWPGLCFELWEVTGWDERTYEVEVSATSFTGETATRTYTWEIPDGRRPPVGFELLNDHDVRIGVPIKAGMGASVTAIAADDPATCTDVEASGRDDFGEVLPSDDSGFIIDWGRQSSDVAYAGTETYDPAYDANQVVNLLHLREGSRYRLCIWWLEGAERSFDESTIVEREIHTIVTPSSLRPLIRLRSVENTTGRDLGPGEFSISAACPNSTTIALPGLEEGQTQGIPLADRPTLCDYAGAPYPDAQRVEVTADAHSTTFAIPLSHAGEPRSERFTADLSADGPEPGFGTGTLSDGSLRGPQATFDVRYRSSAGDGSAEWHLGDPYVFEPPPDESEELDDVIRIDSFASSVSAAGRNAIRVDAAFDRPVRLSASLLSPPFAGLSGEGLCLTGPRPTASSSGFSESHSFTMDGLCLHTFYTVLLEAVDEEGNTGVFTDMTQPAAVFLTEAGPHSDFSGTARTDGYEVRYQLLWTQTDGPPGSVASPTHLAAFEVRIDGKRFDLRGDGCFDELRPLVDPAVTGEDAWGEEVVIEVSLAIREGSPDAGCEPTAGASGWRASVTSTIPSVAALGEDPFEVRIPITATEPLGRESPIGIELTIRGSVRG